MKRCPQCHTTNPVESTTCVRCGVWLAEDEGRTVNRRSPGYTPESVWGSQEVAGHGGWSDGSGLSTEQQRKMMENGNTLPPGTRAPLYEGGSRASADVLLGKQIGNYRLEEKIGRGGFGSIYHARHLFLDQSVAIKLLHTERQTDESILTRFHREAKALSKLSHENIVYMSDFGLLSDVGFYLVMEYLDGKNLHQCLLDGESFDLFRIEAILGQLSDALHYVHLKGIVHRDLKPANIFLTRDEEGNERAVLLDFGIASLFDERDGLTEVGTYLGTANFASPEQADSQNEPDGRSDLYSLGIVLYLLLTERLPFYSDNALTVIYHQLHTRPPLLREIAPLRSWAVELEDFVQVVLSKTPGDRPVDGAEFGRRCRAALEAQRQLEESERGFLSSPTQPMQRFYVAPQPASPQVEEFQEQRGVARRETAATLNMTTPANGRGNHSTLVDLEMELEADDLELTSRLSAQVRAAAAPSQSVSSGEPGTAGQGPFSFSQLKETLPEGEWGEEGTVSEGIPNPLADVLANAEDRGWRDEVTHRLRQSPRVKRSDEVTRPPSSPPPDLKKTLFDLAPPSFEGRARREKEKVGSGVGSWTLKRKLLVLILSALSVGLVGWLCASFLLS